MPVFENGIQICEGSPSRAQYIEGQPRDSRAPYAYRPEWEQRYRDAYAKAQADYQS